MKRIQPAKFNPDLQGTFYTSGVPFDDVLTAIVEEIDVQGPDGEVTSVKVAHPGAKPTVLSESPSVSRWKDTFLIRAQDRPGVIVNVGASEQRIREWLPDFGYTSQEIDAIVGVVRGQNEA